MSRCELSFQQKGLYQQGYVTYTPEELRQLELGLRFTPAACSLIALFAYLYQLPWLLLAVAALGIWAFLAPAAHPMDMLYNNVVRPMLGSKVKLPPNPFQRRLACLAAGIMNIAGAVFFFLGMPVAAWITGGMLLTLQAIVIFTHFCTLSYLYEGIMKALGRWTKPIEPGHARKVLSEGAILVDVRGPDEFAQGHVKEALNLPLEELEKHLEILNKCPALLYCRSGNRSQIAYHKLRGLGLKNIYDLGGFQRAKEIVRAE